MAENPYDVVIIGAGPAGIQAAIHASRKKTSVLMLGRIENSALYNAHIENYACLDGVHEGRELLEAGMAQVKRFGTEVSPEDVLKIGQEGELFSLDLESGRTITTRSLIFCMGVSKKKLGVPGEKEFAGRGVSYCVDCDANFYRGATVAVAGNRSAAIDGALTLLGYADKVYLIARELRASDDLLERLKSSEVEVIEGTWVKEILGENAVTGLRLEDDRELEVEGIFIELGSKGALELATQIGVMLDSEFFKYIDTTRKQETNIPGIYAAGDICGPPYQMAKAVGEGCVAGMEAATYARRQKRAG
ncbi:thioredoxin reductase [Desulfolithobacter dissulfuricans]|uniref:Thioredoxin reductase n=1 Tax=Desulfolithobacter dissulfuricans TaxID=2795293 RepID=A0A915XI13_9BACT|nr:NAD(P)/FAD-dependent oxidoreductase [Desulfolithobacter dissulfuricans]BCO08680.1 thioredoxin reductase [Desulfolithobacter dissulfuricans]